MIYAIDDMVKTNLKNEKVLKYKIVRNLVKKIFKKIEVLEIGCGGGTIVRTLAVEDMISDFFGYDPDKKAIEHAKKNVRYNLFFIDDLNKVNKFDLVFLIDVMEHAENPDELIKQVKEKTLNDGYVLIHVPLEKCGIYSFKRCRDIKSMNSDHICFYNFDDIKQILERNDLQIVESFFHYHFISGFRDFLKYFMFSKTPDISKDIIYTKNWYQKMKFSKYLFYILDYLAYYESKFLRNIEFFSSGVTVTVRRK